MKPDPEYVTVQLKADVYQLVEAIAKARGVKVADYLSQIARPVAESDYAKLSQMLGKVRRLELG
jgi:hypothetical protein